MFNPKFGTVKPYHKNQVIFKEGQPGNVGYLVRSGEVTIYKIIDEKKTVLNTLGPGEVFGEMRIITKQPRTACAEAAEFCELVIIDKETLYSMLKKSPKMVQSITLLLIKRLASTLDMLDVSHEQAEKNKLTTVSDILMLMARYGHEIDYMIFCNKVTTVTGMTQKDMDLILQQLAELRAVEIVRDDNTADSGSGWKLTITDPGLLPEAGL